MTRGAVAVGVACVVLAAAGFALAVSSPTPRERRARLGGACLAGDASACAEVGELLARGDLGPARAPEDEPGAWFERACDGGARGACAAAQESARVYGDYEIFELDAACVLDRDPFACEETARDLHSEADETEDPAASAADEAIAERRRAAVVRSRMERAACIHGERCARGDAESCLGEGHVLDAGFGVPWNPRAARDAIDRACTLGLARACEEEADGSPQGSGAVALYRRACALPGRSPHACLKLARAEEATGAPREIVAASYARACDLLALEACHHLPKDPG